MTTARRRTRGICRIDQPEKHNQGFFVRLQRRGKIHPAFFSDKRHGGREKALAAAQAHYQKMLKRFGPPMVRSRLWWAEIRRRRGRSAIVGVQRIVVRRPGYTQAYWRATWSPEPYVIRKKVFSIQKHGGRRAKALAIRARRAGLRSMVK